MIAADYILEIEWLPTFHPRSLWTIARGAGATVLEVQILSSANESAYEATLVVPPILAESLYQVSCYVLSQDANPRNFEQRDDNFQMRDGIGALGALCSDAFSIDFFEFRSPRSEHWPHRMVEALFELVRSQNIDPILASYMQMLRPYFDFEHSPF